MSTEVAVLLYPGGVFFEVALAVETLAPKLSVSYYSPDGLPHQASNGAVLQVHGSYERLAGSTRITAVLVPGGDPKSILLPENLARAALVNAAIRGALVAGICAGNLVIASAGLLRGRRGTHNYTLEHASPEMVATVAPYWEGMTFARANIVKDGSVITAQPWAYRQYSAAVAQHLGVLSEAEARDHESYPVRRGYGAA